jgi:hypothetical protein
MQSRAGGVEGGASKTCHRKCAAATGTGIFKAPTTFVPLQGSDVAGRCPATNFGRMTELYCARL